MPTLDDLRDAFADLERRAPAARALRLPAQRPGARTGGRQRPARRTWLPAVLASAAVLAVALGVVLSGLDGPADRSSRSGALASPSAHHQVVGKPATVSSAAVRPSTSISAAGTASGPSPVRISGLPGLHVIQLDPQLRAGGLTVQDSDGVRWDFGWGNTELDPAAKPDTRIVTFAARRYIVYPDGVGRGLNGVGVSAHGFGMTITATEHAGFTLADYKPFLTHVHFARTLSDRTTWFSTAVAG